MTTSRMKKNGSSKTRRLAENVVPCTLCDPWEYKAFNALDKHANSCHSHMEYKICGIKGCLRPIYLIREGHGCEKKTSTASTSTASTSTTA